PAYHTLIGTGFETVGDAIACGCILAFMRDQLWSMRRYREFLMGYGPYVALAVVVVASALGDRSRINAVVGTTAMTISIALLIDSLVRKPSGRVGRVLNAPAAKYIGVLSYSIYLWQQLFLDRESTATLATFPINIIALAVVAVGSYYVIERPSL